MSLGYLTLPRISTFKKNINYLRGEADSLALELRFHNSEIHNKFISKNILANKNNLFAYFFNC